MVDAPIWAAWSILFQSAAFIIPDFITIEYCYAKNRPANTWMPEYDKLVASLGLNLEELRLGRLMMPDVRGRFKGNGGKPGKDVAAE
eukprot:scaffold51854_cov20-Tisochrysis_lutea.AAC.1